MPNHGPPRPSSITCAQFWSGSWFCPRCQCRLEDQEYADRCECGWSTDGGYCSCIAADKREQQQDGAWLAEQYAARRGGPPCPACGADDVAHFVGLFGSCPCCLALVELKEVTAA